MPRTLQVGQCAELYLLNVVTGEIQLRFTSERLLFEAPNWSPDGRTIFVNGDGRLFRLGVTDGDLEEVDLGHVPAINNDHVLSPDGGLMYVSCDDGHIYAVPIPVTARHATPQQETQIRRVTNDHGPGFRHYLHGVSPDGQHLVYIGLRISDHCVTTNVFTIPSAGEADVQLTDDHFPDDGAEFSPDGNWIYFNSERGSDAPGHAQLFRIPSHGGEPEQLTHDERVNWFPHPSPDGSMLAYVSFPPGTLGHPADLDVVVRLRDSDGHVRDLAQVFGGQGTMNVPSWDPTGTWIAYVAYPIKGNEAAALVHRDIHQNRSRLHS